MLKRIDWILAILILLSWLMLLNTLPGAHFFITIFSLTLALVYGLFSFALFNGIGFRAMFKKESYKEVAGKNIVLAVLLGFVFAAAVVSVLFYAEKLTGWEIMLMSAFSQLVFMAILLLIFYRKKDNSFYKRVLPRFVILSLLVTFFYFIPLN